uniref:Ig-like domain-containing protein n=1 Tax=Varanus komodoensis TaxID=61221 RepID=A0A8D2LY08_VARKO
MATWRDLPCLPPRAGCRHPQNVEGVSPGSPPNKWLLGLCPKEARERFTAAAPSVRVDLLVTPSPELLEGDSASLACNMRALSPEGSVFSWYRNGRRLAGHNASVLAFPSITSGDAGSYHCQARSLEEGGASISLPVSITVYCE